MHTKEKLPGLFNYCFLAFPLTFASIPIYLYSPDLYAAGYGLSLSLLGGLLFALRVFDAFLDPIIGDLCDQYASTRKKRSFVVIIGLFVMFIGFFFLFHPALGKGYLAIYYCFFVFLSTLGYSLVWINFYTLGSLWSHDYYVRTVISSWREISGAVALILISVIPVVLQTYYSVEKTFVFLVYITLPITVLSAFLFLKWSKNLPKNLGVRKRKKLEWSHSSVLKLLKIKKIKQYFVLYFILTFADIIPTILFFFYLRDYLQAENLTFLFLFIYSVSSIIGLLLWMHLSKKYKKRHIWMMSMGLGIISYSACLFITPENVIIFGGLCFFIGIAFAGDLGLAPSILSDIITDCDLEEHSTQLFGVSSFLFKLGIAIASGVLLPLLAYIGYKPAAESPDIAINSLAFATLGLPAISYMIGLAYLKFSHIDHPEMDLKEELYLYKESTKTAS